MREAVIVSTARTPIGRAYRGAFNDTQAQELIGHAVRHAVERAGVEGEQIEDVVIGAALQQGSTAMNIGRQAALRAGLPVSVAGMSVDRQCASGLMAIATAAKQIITDRMDAVAAGGQESISLVQPPPRRVHRRRLQRRIAGLRPLGDGRAQDLEIQRTGDAHREGRRGGDPPRLQQDR